MRQTTILQDRRQTSAEVILKIVFKVTLLSGNEKEI